mgnify:CR=1 FL=1
MAALLALLSALVYGAGDFFGGLASRRAPAVLVTIWAQVVGLVGLSLAVAVVPSDEVTCCVRVSRSCALAACGASVRAHAASAYASMPRVRRYFSAVRSRG